MAPGGQAVIAVKPPLPSGTRASLWRNEVRFISSSTKNFPGYYQTSSGGYIDEDGYRFVMGRMDDVTNIAGHRLPTSTAAMKHYPCRAKIL